jgi:hypothetical protein
VTIGRLHDLLESVYESAVSTQVNGVQRAPIVARGPGEHDDVFCELDLKRNQDDTFERPPTSDKSHPRQPRALRKLDRSA